MKSRILTVCTGNICRSPLAVALLRSGLEGLPIVVESAGTGAIDGVAATSETIELATRLGGHELWSHRSRFLTESVLSDVDLVLTMTIGHSEAVLRLAPALTMRTFTIREFAALVSALDELDISAVALSAGHAPSDRIRTVARIASTARGPVPSGPAQLDVIDPYRRGQTAYEQSAALLVPAVDATVDALKAVLEQ